MPEDSQRPAGEGILRNPGAVCIWTTLRFEAFKAYAGRAGILFEIGDPEHTEWFAEGRPATRAEVDAAIVSGLPLLFEPAQREDAAKPGRGAVAELQRRIERETIWLDDQVWPEAAA